MAERVPDKTVKLKSGLMEFYSNPLVGIIGSFASVLGIFLAIYFYIESKEAAQLTYYVNPIKTILVRAGQVSKLSVNYNNNEIETDIAVAQIALWNHGKRAIKKTNILKPITIYTENNAPILEAVIRKASRDVTQLYLDTTELDKGRVTILWNILEQNDGGVIQLIYAGSPDLKLRVAGTVEGQRHINQLEFSDKIKTPEEQYVSIKREKLLAGILSLFIGFSITSLFFFKKFMDRKVRKMRKIVEEYRKLKSQNKSKKSSENIANIMHLALSELPTPNLLERLLLKIKIEEPILSSFVLFSSFSFVVAGLYFLFSAKEIGPPFGF